MGIITALAVIIGIMGGIATTIWLQLVLNTSFIYFVIWVTFVAWASFYAAGGGQEGLMKSTAANIWGALIAAISLWIFVEISDNMNAPIAAGLCVGIAIIVLILGANVPALGFIPGQVFGYAPTAALFASGMYATVFEASMTKLFIACVLSLIIGNVLGFISEKAAGAVAKS